MASITVRNLPDEVHRALRVLAAQHGRSAEAEIRDILERAVKPAKRVRLGDALAALGRKVGITDEDVAVIDQMRDRSPPRAASSSRHVTRRLTRRAGSGLSSVAELNAAPA